MITQETFTSILDEVLSKPGMYRLQKVEDIEIFILGEIIFHRNVEIEEWSSTFTKFVEKNVDSRLKGFNWSRIIRLYSGSDSHSIELFKTLFQKFLVENVNNSK